MDEVVIRVATVADTPAIGDLWQQLVDYHREIDAELPEATPKGSMLYARRIADRLDDPQTRVLVAADSEKLVGYVLGMVVNLTPDIFEQEPTGFLADIFVAADYRQQGIGSRLVDALARWFREQNLPYYEWHVAAANHNARAFWKRVGGDETMIRMRSYLGDEA